LKNNRREFKEGLAKLMEAQKKSLELEKKAVSGELMNEMIANNKIE
jgi:hypothetical protein